MQSKVVMSTVSVDFVGEFVNDLMELIEDSPLGVIIDTDKILDEKSDNLLAVLFNKIAELLTGFLDNIFNITVNEVGFMGSE